MPLLVSCCAGANSSARRHRPAAAIEAETGEPVAQRVAEAVARFDGVFMPQKPKVSARRFIQEIQFRLRSGRRRADVLSHRVRSTGE
jgi:hypothetical protein